MSDSFSRRRAHMIQLKARREGVETDVPRRHAAKAAFSKCPHCGAGVSKRELARTLYVCPQCGYHHPIGAYLRLSMLLDSKSFCELEERLAAPNTLGFRGRPPALPRAQWRRGERWTAAARFSACWTADSSWAVWEPLWGKR